MATEQDVGLLIEAAKSFPKKDLPEEPPEPTFEEKYGISSQEPFVRNPTAWERSTSRLANVAGGVRDALTNQIRNRLFATPFEQPTVGQLEKTGVVPEMARTFVKPPEERELGKELAVGMTEPAGTMMDIRDVLDYASRGDPGGVALSGVGLALPWTSAALIRRGAARRALSAGKPEKAREIIEHPSYADVGDVEPGALEREATYTEQLDTLRGKFDAFLDAGKVQGGWSVTPSGQGEAIDLFYDIIDEYGVIDKAGVTDPSELATAFMPLVEDAIRRGKITNTTNVFQKLHPNQLNITRESVLRKIQRIAKEDRTLTKPRVPQSIVERNLPTPQVGPRAYRPPDSMANTAKLRKGKTDHDLLYDPLGDPIAEWPEFWGVRPDLDTGLIEYLEEQGWTIKPDFESSAFDGGEWSGGDYDIVAEGSSKRGSPLPPWSLGTIDGEVTSPISESLLPYNTMTPAYRGTSYPGQGYDLGYGGSYIGQGMYVSQDPSTAAGYAQRGASNWLGNWDRMRKQAEANRFKVRKEQLEATKIRHHAARMRSDYQREFADLTPEDIIDPYRTYPGKDDLDVVTLGNLKPEYRYLLLALGSRYQHHPSKFSGEVYNAIRAGERTGDLDPSGYSWGKSFIAEEPTLHRVAEIKRLLKEHIESQYEWADQKLRSGELQERLAKADADLAEVDKLEPKATMTMYQLRPDLNILNSKSSLYKTLDELSVDFYETKKAAITKKARQNYLVTIPVTDPRVRHIVQPRTAEVKLTRPSETFSARIKSIAQDSADVELKKSGRAPTRATAASGRTFNVLPEPLQSVIDNARTEGSLTFWRKKDISTMKYTDEPDLAEGYVVNIPGATDLGPDLPMSSKHRKAYFEAQARVFGGASDPLLSNPQVTDAQRGYASLVERDLESIKGLQDNRKAALTRMATDLGFDGIGDVTLENIVGVVIFDPNYAIKELTSVDAPPWRRP